MNTWSYPNILFCLGLCLLGILYLYVLEVSATLPYEDAAILMRYVDNFAHGEGYVWNTGEAPVDGATDFLFVLLAAGLQYLGLSTELAVQQLCIAAYLGTAVLIFMAWRDFSHSLFYAIIPAILAFLGPATAYIEAYFATTFFAFLGTLLAFWGLKLILNPLNKLYAVCFGITSLLLGLCRPEGVFLSFFLLCGLLYYLKRNSAKRLMRYYLIFLVGIGSFYLMWHYLYFGHLLPNPFYKKGGGLIYTASLQESLSNCVKLLLPFCLWVGLHLHRKDLKNRVLFVSLPLFAFAVIWILLSNEMNYLMRFQYVVYPIALIQACLVFQAPSQADRPGIFRKIVAISVLIFIGVYYGKAFESASIQKDGRYVVAHLLQKYQEQGYGLACTEAGLLPFYSGWRSLDTWGLNDHKIAVEGVISTQYLSEFEPTLIMYDAYVDSEESLRGTLWDSYGDMIDTLNLYIEQNNFVLAAKFPDRIGRHAHYYYLKQGLPDADLLLEDIRTCTYFWYEDGMPTEPEFHPKDD